MRLIHRAGLATPGIYQRAAYSLNWQTVQQKIEQYEIFCTAYYFYMGKRIDEVIMWPLSLLKVSTPA